MINRLWSGLAALAVLLAPASPVLAKGEYRRIDVTWRLYGGNSGDFDTPEAVIAAWNAKQEANYAANLGVNCAQGGKTLYTLTDAVTGPNANVNGLWTYRVTDGGVSTSYVNACYVNGVKTRDASGPFTQQNNGGIAVVANFRCLAQWSAYSESAGTITVNGSTYNATRLWCQKDVSDPPKTCGRLYGNPVDAVAAAKLDMSVDYSAADSLLRVARSYSSSAGRWSWNHEAALFDFTGRGSVSTATLDPLTASLSLVPAGIYNTSAPPAVDTPRVFPLLAVKPGQVPNQVWVTDGTGSRTVFTDAGNNTFSTSDPSKPALSFTGSGSSLQWLIRADRVIRLFDAAGRLTQEVFRDGSSLTYDYGATTRTVTAFPGGRQLIYSKSNLSGPYDRVTLPDGSTLAYSIDGFGQVHAVTFPDGTAKTYLYNEAAYTGTTDSQPQWLTGLTDENGTRQATYRYNGSLPLSTELAGGVNKYQFGYSFSVYSFGLPDSYSTVTDPLGSTSQLYWVAGPDGERNLASQSQPAGSGCSASSSNRTYDAAGNVAQSDDNDGLRTCFAYDLNRNLQTARVEGLTTAAACSTYTPANAALPAGARKISSQWHPDWRVQTQTAEPGRLTTYVYNGQPDPFNGNAIANCAPTTALLPDGKPIAVLCKQVEQATADADGHLGFTASLQSGVPNRVWSYTYNPYGQVLSATDPRGNTTTYAYYADTTTDHTVGDLASVTHALNRTTQYTKYNRHGQVLQTVDTNGVTTDYTYDLRQRPTGVSAAGQTTSFSYWPTGLLQQATQPDGSSVAFTYDDAHRLTDVSDNLGNRVHYTLDAAGNRTQEQTQDPSGSLSRQLSRVMDVLSRVQQATGRE